MNKEKSKEHIAEYIEQYASEKLKYVKPECKIIIVKTEHFICISSELRPDAPPTNEAPWGIDQNVDAGDIDVE